MTSSVVAMDELEGLVGQHLGYSDWHEITQQRVNLFADATDDHQWIHLDPERAAAGPFGGTIAHGYLTLSLLPWLMGEIFVVDGSAMGINYGLDRVRFPSPVPVGSRLRMGAAATAATPFEGGLQVTFTCTFEVEGASKPSCVAEAVFRFYR